ncbi:hypothetical protein B0H67DRAFT_676085 [Lasiosphaeris hirsuta]|uniref:Uncharacterized protein n=1 Tax=Lasiosphaeris hirsuta TaxID=260670 RepID=A0AA39ZSJ1_9PEZI|nr:hypothetical protein B0H67DRAFT_676085 [Lasiosphaeris hirsuta]
MAAPGDSNSSPLSSAASTSALYAISNPTSNPEDETATSEERNVSTPAVGDASHTSPWVSISPARVVSEPLQAAHADPQSGVLPDQPDFQSTITGTLHPDGRWTDHEPSDSQVASDIELRPMHGLSTQTLENEQLTGHGQTSSSQLDQAVLFEHGQDISTSQAGPLAPGGPETDMISIANQHCENGNQRDGHEAASAGGQPGTTLPQVVSSSWRPLSFRLWSLCLFTALTLAANAALLDLFIMSEKNQGIGPVASVSVLVRRFVPTAVITVLRLLWGHIDFRVRQMQPWMVLQEGPTPAARGIDADYISTFMPKKLWIAFRNRHWLVVCTMIGTLLWMAMIVFAGGLFYEADVRINEPAELLATDRFDAVSFLGKTGPDSRMVYALLAVDHSRFRLSLPPGTTSRHAVQSFKLAPDVDSQENGHGNLTLTGQVDVFSGDLECEIGTVTSMPAWVSFCGPSSGNFRTCSVGPGFLINITTPTCSLINISTPAQQSAVGFENEIPNDQYYGDAQLMNCSNPGSTGRREYRLLVTLLLSREPRSNIISCKGCSPVNPPHLEMLHLSHILCKTGYYIEPGIVTTSGIGTNLRGSLSVLPGSDSGNRTTLNGVSSDYFAARFFDSLTAASQIEDLFSQANETVHVPPLLHLAMLHNSNGIDDLLEPQALEQSFAELYRGLSAQFAKTQMMSPVADTISGTKTFVERRLLVRRVSFGGMQEIFLLIYALILCLFWHLRSWELPYDPSSIASTALLLRKSQDLLRRADGLGHIPRTETSRFVGPDRRFEVRRDASIFQIAETRDMSDDQEARNSSSQASQSQTRLAADAIKYWTGYPMKWFGIVLYTAVPLLLIVGLEISFWQINTRDQLGGVLPAAAVRYVWAYIPVAVMVVASLVLVSFNLSVVTATPYLALHRGHAAPRDSVLVDYIARPSLFAIGIALKRRHWAVAAASAASIISAFLAIVAGGLFFDERVSLSTAVEIELAHIFLSTPFEENDNTIPSLYAHLIVHNNLTYPDGTYRDLVLPHLNVGKLKDQIHSRLVDEATILEVELPALQPQLSCTTIRSDQIGIDRDTDDNGVAILDPTIGIPLPRCVASVADPSQEDGIPRLAYDLGYFPERGYFGGVGTFGLPSESCPAMFVVLGRVDGLAVEDVSAITCTGFVVEIAVRATFRFHTDDEGVSLSGPPTVMNHIPARNFSQSSIYFLNGIFNEVDVTMKGTDAVIDSFLQAAVYGQDGVPLSELLGKNGSNTTRLSARANELYQIAVAQYIDQSWRYEMKEEDQNVTGSFPAQVIYPNRVWLRQSLVETRLLDAMLAALFICAVILYLLVRPRSVVPKNPYPILSIASLLAGSRWLALLESKQAPSVVADRSFSLKWWGGPEDGNRRFGIDVDEENESS